MVVALAKDTLFPLASSEKSRFPHLPSFPLSSSSVHTQHRSGKNVDDDGETATLLLSGAGGEAGGEIRNICGVCCMLRIRNE